MPSSTLVDVPQDALALCGTFLHGIDRHRMRAACSLLYGVRVGPSATVAFRLEHMESGAWSLPSGRLGELWWGARAGTVVLVRRQDDGGDAVRRAVRTARQLVPAATSVHIFVGRCGSFYAPEAPALERLVAAETGVGWSGLLELSVSFDTPDPRQALRFRTELPLVALRTASLQRLEGAACLLSTLDDVRGLGTNPRLRELSLCTTLGPEASDAVADALLAAFPGVAFCLLNGPDTEALPRRLSEAGVRVFRHAWRCCAPAFAHEVSLDAVAASPEAGGCISVILRPSTGGGANGARWPHTRSVVASAGCGFERDVLAAGRAFPNALRLAWLCAVPVDTARAAAAVAAAFPHLAAFEFLSRDVAPDHASGFVGALLEHARGLRHAFLGKGVHLPQPCAVVEHASVRVLTRSGPRMEFAAGVPWPDRGDRMPSRPLCDALVYHGGAEALLREPVADVLALIAPRHPCQIKALVCDPQCPPRLADGLRALLPWAVECD